MPTKLQLLRTKALADQHGRCWYCTVRIWNKSPSELPGLLPEQYRHLQATAEHLRARCDGGGDTRDNVVAACFRCNHTRHQRKQPPQPAAFRSEIERRIRAGRWHCRSVHLLGLVLTA